MLLRHRLRRATRWVARHQPWTIVGGGGVHDEQSGIIVAMLNPAEIQGAWRLGWTLDVHTTSSEFLGYDQNGHAQFSTTRSELGELLYQLKYRGQTQAAERIAAAMAGFLRSKPNALSRIDALVAMPASATRKTQPVAEITRELGKLIEKPVISNGLRKTRETPGLKDIHEPEKRRELLDGAFAVDDVEMRNKCVLLVDDLYRSGATANAVTVALLGAGASPVYLLVATRTRSNV